MSAGQKPKSIEWRKNEKHPFLTEAFIGDRMVAWIEARPGYCDRGHWKANIQLPPGANIDQQDCFPRYFMRLEVAKGEMEDFIRWRLWGVRAIGQRVPFTRDEVELVLTEVFDGNPHKPINPGIRHAADRIMELAERETP